MKVEVTLAHMDKQYTFVFPSDFNNHDHALYMFTEGNYGCDCNRSLFISQYADDKFPEMDCGGVIQLISLEEVNA